MGPPALLLALLALAADPRARLEALRERRAAEEQAARALERREGSLLEALDGAEEGWIQADAASRAAEAEQARVAARLAQARADEEAAQRAVAGLEERLGPRLRARARMGDATRLRALAASASLAEAVQVRWAWDRVVANDLALVADARGALARREAARAAVERDAAALQASADAADRQREAAAARRSQYRDVLAAIRGERSLHRRAATEAEQQQARLAEFVAALPPPAPGAPLHGGFAQLRGRLPWPVAGTIAVGFGPVVNPRFNTTTLQRGVELRAAAGAEVRAVAPGRVAHAGWFKGFGNLVIVDHGDGFHTLVAHLASIATAMGEEVGAGARLGTVGEGGAIPGPSLYFELRERGRPVDPRGWLRPEGR